MAHNKDVLVSEFDSSFTGIPFCSYSVWKRDRLQSQYRIPNRRLKSVTNSFIGENQKVVDTLSRRALNLNDNETAIIATHDAGRYGTLIILTEVDHVTIGHPDYFKR